MGRILMVALFIFAPFAQAEVPILDRLIPGSWIHRESDPQVVETVDFNRYVGMWYDIAHEPNFFQRNCLRSTAEYQILSPDSVSVHNICYKKDGETDDIKGVAKVTDSRFPAKLEVDFGFMRKGDYWIIDLADDYSYAVVSAPNKKSLWILSRTAKMDAAVYQQIITRLKGKGFDLTKLTVTEQI